MLQKRQQTKIAAIPHSKIISNLERKVHNTIKKVKKRVGVDGFVLFNPLWGCDGMGAVYPRLRVAYRGLWLFTPSELVGEDVCEEVFAGSRLFKFYVMCFISAPSP